MFWKKKKEEKLFGSKAIQNFLLGIVYGIGQALGLTIVFALIVTYFAKLFEALGGLPYIGILVADIAEVAQRTLESLK